MECMKEKQQSLPELWVHPADHLRIVRDGSVGTFGVLMSESSGIAQPALQTSSHSTKQQCDTSLFLSMS